MQRAAFLRPAIAIAALSLLATGIACTGKGAEEASDTTAAKAGAAAPPPGPMVAPRSTGMAAKTGAPATRGGGGGMPSRATDQAQ